MRTSYNFLDYVTVYGGVRNDIDITILFPRIRSYNTHFRGIVINTSDTLPNDGNIHIFIDQEPSGSYYDVLHATDDSYGFGRLFIIEAKGGDEKRVKENERLHTRLYEYLIGENFVDERVGNDTFRPDCSFNKFARISKPSTVTAYIKSIIAAVREHWDRNHGTMKFPDYYEREMMNYKNKFEIMFISNTVNPDPHSNYQLYEYIGDQTGWSAMNNIFIKFLSQDPPPRDEDGNVIVLNQNNITSMHRDLFSKNIQAKLARKLGVEQFIQINGDMVNKIYGDIYEAMIGTFLMIDYHISSRIRIESDSKVFNFHVAFLEWTYESVDLSKFEKKPYYTQFTENTTALFGSSYFKHIDTSGYKITQLRNRSDRDKLIENAKTFRFVTTEEVKDMSRVVEKIINTATKNTDKGDAGIAFIDNERAKFNELNRYIEREFGSDEIVARKTRNNITDWTEDQVNEFVALMKEQHGNDYVLNKHSINKYNTSFYWVIESVKEKTLLYTTENYDNSEDPDLLITLIRRRMMDKAVVVMPEFVEMTSDNRHRTYVTIKNGNEVIERRQRETGEGNRDDSLEKALCEDDRITLNIQVKVTHPGSHPNRGKHHGHLHYSPHPKNIFERGFDVKEFFTRFGNTVKYTIENGIIKVTNHKNVSVAKRSILGFIGDRLSNKAYLFVSLMRHKIMNESHLTNIKNYFRSVILKDHFTYLMRLHCGGDSDSLSFDEYIGLVPHMFENLLYELFKNVRIDDSFIETPQVKLKKIRNAVDKHDYGKENPFDVYKDNDTTEAWLIYRSSTGLSLTCKVGHRSIIILRDLFAKYCARYEASLKDKNILLTRINARFRHVKSYDRLKQIMEIRNVHDWELMETTKLDMRFTLKFKSDESDDEESGIYTYVTEKNLDEIIRILTNTRV